MGSFNATCIVSNLPIEAGTPVRFLALARNAFDPDGAGHVCYVGGRWQLHGVPLKAEYNDYGSVNEMEDSFTSRMFFEGLARRAVELGTGDNSCHDVPVREDMGPEGWLEALREGRVKVQDYRPSKDKWGGFSSEPKDGVPSLRRIEKVLKDAGHEIKASRSNPGFLIDEVGTGFVRVRKGGYGVGTEGLNEIVPLLQTAGYAAMVTAGTGSYAKGAEIIVGPLPSNPKAFIHADHEKKDINPSRPVSQAMIREDVWQILLETPTDSWAGKFGKEDMRKAALEALAEDVAQKKERERIGEMSEAELQKALRRDFEINEDHRNIFRGAIRGHEGISGYSFREAYVLGIELAGSPEEAEALVLDMADTVYVQWTYSILHGQWHPTTNSGQEPAWKGHRAFMAELMKIRGRWEDEEDGTDEE